MKRLTAYVVGQIYISSFQLRLYTSATRFGLKGCAEALDDGRIRIIAEGEDENLRKFADALEAEDSPIKVPSVTLDYSDATGSFNDFETGYDWESAFLGICDIIAYKPDLVRQLISDLQESIEKSKEKK